MIIDAVVPCYRVRAHVCDVVRRALAQDGVRNVVAVDDGCPEKSGELVRATFAQEPRVKVLFHTGNQGVGGAVCTGYSQAFGDGADVVVKVDGDGQIAPELIGTLVAPIQRRQADYAKGNRFFYPRHLAQMPRVRLFGNACLSLVSKASSGYWAVMDPTNGFTALHRVAYEHLEPQLLSRDYFFESDMLYRLGIIRAVVADVPTPVVYGGEQSSLRIGRVLLQFPGRFFARVFRRVAFHYFIRDFNVASLELLFGFPLLIAGLAFGGYHWWSNAAAGELTPPGTVMITGLLILTGFQLLLSAVNYDITHGPGTPLLAAEPPAP